MQTVRYRPHTFAKIFPPMAADEKRELAEDIKKNGLRFPIVLLDDKILDGVHRQEACVNADVPTRYVDWEDLPEAQRGETPLDYIVSVNLKRRHLTTSQRALIATYLIRVYAKENEAGASKEARANGSELDEKSERKSAAKAAKAMNVSRASVERAQRVAKKSPELAKQVRAGKISLGKAHAKVSGEDKKKAEREAAISRIEKICGPELAKAVRNRARLKTHKDAVEFAGMSDTEMRRVQGLIEEGWPLKKARLFEAKNLTARHRIQDLFNKAMSNGFELTVDIDGWWIEVKLAKRALLERTVS